MRMRSPHSAAETFRVQAFAPLLVVACASENYIGLYSLTDVVMWVQNTGELSTSLDFDVTRRHVLRGIDIYYSMR